MNLAEEIRSKREAAGLSQEQLAEKFNISRQAVYKWENGLSKPSAENMRLLREILDVDIPENEPDSQNNNRSVKKQKIIAITGWSFAVLLLIGLILSLLFSGRINSIQTDEQMVNELTVNFYKAFFDDDPVKIKDLMIPPYPQKIFTYSDTVNEKGQITDVFWKHLQKDKEYSLDSREKISVRYKESSSPDAVNYLFIDIIKKTDEWKVENYSWNHDETVYNNGDAIGSSGIQGGILLEEDEAIFVTGRKAFHMSYTGYNEWIKAGQHPKQIPDYSEYVIYTPIGTTEKMYMNLSEYNKWVESGEKEEEIDKYAVKAESVESEEEKYTVNEG